jgi:putative transposase
MKFDPFKHHRRSMRLRGYDYSQAGAYFVTICVQHRQHLFGAVVNGEMDLHDLGMIADECWQAIPNHFPFVELDHYVVMPNHVHGIVVIVDDGRGGRGVQLNAPTGQLNASTEPNAPTESNVPTGQLNVRNQDNRFSVISPQRKTLSVVMRTFKAAVTTRCREIDRADFAWQSSFYDHIIRNEREWNAIAKYIRENPANWDGDKDNPVNFKKESPPKTADDYWRDIGLA